MMTKTFRGRRRAALPVVAGSVLAASVALIAGCAGTIEEITGKQRPHSKISYKTSRSAAPLEVPPDLTDSSLQDSLHIPGVDPTYSQYAGLESGAGARSKPSVLPAVDGARIVRSGDERWLAVAMEPEDVWPRLRDFWVDQGFSLDSENPEIGVMETDWAEKRVHLDQGAVRRLLGTLSKSFFGAKFRDQYRTRIDRGSDPGTTEIYITHRGAEQAAIETGSRPNEVVEFVWRPLPSDSGLEAEMLTRFMVFLGVDQQRADTVVAGAAAPASSAPSVNIIREDGGASALTLDTAFAPAWRRVGLALDRAGFNVEDRDRSRGLYYLRYVDREDDGNRTGGWLSRLKFWGDDDGDGKDDNAYLVRLTEEESAMTRIVVLDRDGERDASEEANRILAVLHEQLG